MYADETPTNGTDEKVNGTDSDPLSPVTSQKYSQILGDHHTNSSTQQHSKNSSQHTFKRGYNNKENFYNQRPGARGAPRSWQRAGNYRNSIVNGCTKKPDENGLNDAKGDSASEPIKFNEGKMRKSFSNIQMKFSELELQILFLL